MTAARKRAPSVGKTLRLAKQDFQALLDLLWGQGYRVVGPTVAQEAIVYDEIRTVDELPRGARPDLSVDGIVEIERLANVLYMARPSNGQEGGTISVFRTMADGMAERRQVKLGKGSVRHIQVLEGLREGERVVLSDMSAWDQVDRLQIK